MKHLDKQPCDEFFVGQSDWTCGVRKRITQVANFRYNVLVTGPSGTGKELVARAIHATSDRHDRPFIPVNCAAIPNSLFSSQLFGHVKGAFTGAQHAALGCFRAADGGTLFLDEIGDLDLDSQAKLLRVLQERKVTPVGGLDDVEVDVRTIAATNRNLAMEVQAGRFRLDLYYRLNVLSIETEALLHRMADIRPLAEHFLAKAAMESGLPFKRLTPDAVRALCGYSWPGNVRELQNTIERALVMSESDVIQGADVTRVLSSTTVSTSTIFAGGLQASEVMANDLASVAGRGSSGSRPAELPTVAVAETLSTCESVKESAPNCLQLDASDDFANESEDWERDWMTLEEVEAQHIRQTLRRTYFNQSAAARLLGVDRKLLARKMKKYDIQLPRRAGVVAFR